MKIFILNTSGAWGGIESHSIILAKTLRKLGHSVILGCYPGSTTQENAIRNEVPYVQIRVKNAMDVKFVSKMVQILKDEKVDVLIANIGKEYWPATVAAKLAGAKIVLYRHQLDPVKKITTWLMSQYVDRVIAVTHAVKKVLLESGVSERRIAVIHPGQEVEKFKQCADKRDEIRMELGIAPNEFVIAAAGKIHYGKGSFDLLEAFKIVSQKYPQSKLMFIGDGEERINLQNMARQMQLEDRIYFTGFRFDIERYLAAIDVFALASKTYESFGMVIIEAMAAGKPVIGTSLGGIPEIITHGQNGLLVEPGKPDQLAQAILILMEDADLRKKLVTDAIDKVDNMFSAQASAQKLIDNLKRL